MLMSLVSGIGDDTNDPEAAKDTIVMTPESAEAIRRSMEMYIKERQAIYSEQLDERVMKEQESA